VVNWVFYHPLSPVIMLGLKNPKKKKKKENSQDPGLPS